MSRSRNGSTILIVLLALFVVAFGVSVFVGYDQKKKKEEEKTRADTVQLEVDKLKSDVQGKVEQLNQISRLVGYVPDTAGEDAIADHRLLRAELLRRKHLKFGFYRIDTADSDITAVKRDRRDAEWAPGSGNTGKIKLGGKGWQWVVKPTPESLEPVAKAPPDANLHVVRLLEYQDRLIDDLVNANHNLWNQLNYVVAAYDTLNKKLDAQKTSFADENNRLLADKKQSEETLRAQVKEANDQFKMIEPTVINEIKVLHAAQTAETEARSEQLQTALKEAEKTIRDQYEDIVRLKGKDQDRAIQRDEPDGTVTYSDRENDLVYIDLGSQDALQKGMKFTVYKPLKGGRRLIKGTIEVKQILDDHYSQCALIQQEPDVEDVYEGDLFYSPLYTRDKPFQVFAFAGKFGGNDTRYSKEHMRKLLTDAGMTVVDKVDVAVDILIVGKDYPTDGEFQRAQELNVPIMTEQQMHQYLGYNR